MSESVLGRGRAASPSFTVQVMAPLLGLEVLLVVLHLLGASGLLGYRLGLWFDLNREQSVGTWFSSAQLLVVALAFALAAPRSSSPRPWFLWLMAAGFAFLSLDETISIHEAITAIARHRARWLPEFPGGHGAWVAVYGVIGAAGLAVTWRELLRLWSGYRVVAIVGAVGCAAYVSGAVAAEIAGYFGLIHDGALQVALEEFLEMLGGSLILLAALELLRTKVRIAPRP
ncbi:MAG: hypothetical protein ACM3W4_09540 [Ignavibacteriales bacterium]